MPTKKDNISILSVDIKYEQGKKNIFSNVLSILKRKEAKIVVA